MHIEETKDGRERLTSDNGQLAFTLFVIAEDPSLGEYFRRDLVAHVPHGTTSISGTDEGTREELVAAAAAYVAEYGTTGVDPKQRRRRVNDEAIHEARTLLAAQAEAAAAAGEQQQPADWSPEAVELYAAIKAYHALLWRDRDQVQPEVGALARLWLATIPGTTDYQARAALADVVHGYITATDLSHPIAAALDEAFAQDVADAVAERNAEIRTPYFERRAELSGQIERYEKDTPAKALTRYKAARKRELTPKKDGKRPDQHGEPFGLGDWVQWTPEGFKAPAIGQVWSRTLITGEWYVTTDRSGVTGEVHRLVRSGKKGSYSYTIDGQRATSLGNGDGPEQLPFEMLVEIPGAEQPKHQKDSPADKRATEEAARIAAETGESVPGGPVIKSERRTSKHGGSLPEWDVKVDGADYNLEWIQEEQEVIVRTGKFAHAAEQIIGYTADIGAARAMCVRHHLGYHDGQMRPLENNTWRLDLDALKYVIRARITGEYEVTYEDELIASVRSLRAAHRAAANWHQAARAGQAPAVMDQPVPEINELYVPGEFVWVEAEHDKQTPFVGDVVGYTRNGSHRIRELAHGTTCDYPWRRLRPATAAEREADKARQEDERDARKAEKERKAAEMRAQREAYEARRDAEQAAAGGVVAEVVDGREWGIGVRLAGTVKLTPVTHPGGETVRFLSSLSEARVAEALAGLGYELAESWGERRQVIVPSTSTSGNLGALRVYVRPLAEVAKVERTEQPSMA